MTSGWVPWLQWSVSRKQECKLHRAAIFLTCILTLRRIFAKIIPEDKHAALTPALPVSPAPALTALPNQENIWTTQRKVCHKWGLYLGSNLHIPFFFYIYIYITTDAPGVYESDTGGQYLRRHVWPCAQLQLSFVHFTFGRLVETFPFQRLQSSSTAINMESTTTTTTTDHAYSGLRKTTVNWNVSFTRNLKLGNKRFSKYRKFPKQRRQM